MQSTRSMAIVCSRLRDSGTEAQVLAIGDGVSLVVARRGGRIYGPFVDGEETLGWTCPDLRQPRATAAGNASGGWNLGGERIWLSPELDFFVGDRARFWETFSVPEAIDPGNYSLAKSAHEIHLVGKTQVGSRDGDSANVEIDRPISPVERAASDGGSSGLRIGHYRQAICIRSDRVQHAILPWLIQQVRPEGDVVIPADEGTCAIAMFGQAPAAVLAPSRQAIRMGVDCRTM